MPDRDPMTRPHTPPDGGSRHRVVTCPACGAPMAESPQRGVRMDRCGACRMVWLDGGELAAVLGAGVRLPEARDDGRQSVGRCPRCDAPLVSRRAGDASWDACPRCGGLLVAAGTLAMLAADAASPRGTELARQRAAQAPGDVERLERLSEEAWLGGPAVHRFPPAHQVRFLGSVYGWLLITAVCFGAGCAAGMLVDWVSDGVRLLEIALVVLAVGLVFKRRDARVNVWLLVAFATAAGMGVGGLAVGLDAVRALTRAAPTVLLAPWAYLAVVIALLTAFWATARHASAEFHLTAAWGCAAGAGVVFVGGLVVGPGPLGVALLLGLVTGACIGFGSADVLRRYTARDAVAGAAHLWLLPVMLGWEAVVAGVAWRRGYRSFRWGRPGRTRIPWEDW